MNTVQFSAWALVTGNALIIKASEQDPLASTAAIRLLQQAGLPDGVLNLVHGRADVVKHLIAHPSVVAVSCITSSPTARAIYGAAAAAGKRVQANGGAKNPIVVAPDADLDRAAAGIVSSSYGMAGQRCLAGSRVVVVGDVYGDLMDRVVALADQLVVGDGMAEGVTMGRSSAPRARSGSWRRWGRRRIWVRRSSSMVGTCSRWVGRGRRTAISSGRRSLPIWIRGTGWRVGSCSVR